MSTMRFVRSKLRSVFEGIGNSILIMNVMINRLLLQEVSALLSLRGKAFQPGENFRENVCAI